MNEKGLDVNAVTLSEDCQLKTADPNEEPIALKKGQTVTMIKTNNGISFLKLGEQFIKLKAGETLFKANNDLEVIELSDDDDIAEC